jgi:hypothetical protein
VAVVSDRQRATGEAMLAGVIVVLGIVTAMVVLILVGRAIAPLAQPT